MGNSSLPRRLVYVVNRRTVVDQATDVAMKIREALRNADVESPAGTVRRALRSLCIDPDNEASPVAVSTLRGELADNREWQADPARAAIIIGTVDMIGSRLLFSGYGVSRRMRPFHAGLLGQDALLVHDEAHLTPAFGKLVLRAAEWQRDRQEPRPLKVLELSATQRDKANGSAPFTLTDEDKAEHEVKRRLAAAKALHLVEATDDRAAAIAALVGCALTYADAQERIIIYVRSPKDAKEIAVTLSKQIGKDDVAVLTGTIRGHERDKLATNPLFEGFRARLDRPPPEQTRYLVATSAGEVGADLDADHMVCDLSTLNSMIQRLGRVNQLGRGAARVHVVEVPARGRDEEESGGVADERLKATKAALRSLRERDGAYDASPQSLRNLVDRLRKGKAIEAGETPLDKCFSKRPRLVPLTDILIDNWSLTRVDDLPGRPLPERWLHGVEGAEPDLNVA